MMDEQRRPVTLSRRQFLGSVATLAGATLLAACGGAPAAEPTRAGATGAGGQAVGGAQPTSPPAAAGAAVTPTPKELTIVAGKFNVWFSANWNIVTDEAVGNTFVEWGKANNIQVEWQSIPGSPLILQKESAALAAGQPPEITNTNQIYWYSQGETGDVTELVDKYKDKEGGMYPLAISSLTATDGKVYAVPYAVDCWPAHWRTDVIGEKTGGTFFTSYDQLLELGPSIQKPPRTNLIAYCLGHEGDHVNSLCSTLWSFGGRINDEKGVPDIKNPANKAGIETVVKMWQAELILKDSFAQTVTSWNNESYQKGRALMTFNPATIMGWLLVNDKELGENTGLSLPVPGPAGAFAEGGAIGFGYFKKAPNAAKSLSALEYLLQPENLQKISKSVEGRFVPVYRGHAKGEFWEKSKFAQLAQIADSGRIRNWPAPAQPWLADVQDAKFTLSDMMNKIINEGMAIESAQEWAQQQMMESYTKFVKA
jgi:ABC-type glycerol-3-phosphate transport system substrate-binding protein